MSPTYFAVRMKNLDEQAKAAWKAGNIPDVQRVAREKTLLLRAMYGTLA
jgi:hypothetical protein